MSTITQSITPQLTTTTEAHHYLTQLRALKSLIYKTDSDIGSKLNHVFTYYEKSAFIQLSEKSGLRLENNEQLLEFIKDLENTITSIPSIKITLGEDFEFDFLGEILSQIESTSGKKMLLDVSIDPSIMGGLTLSINGKYYDYSLRMILEEILSELNAEKKK